MAVNDWQADELLLSTVAYNISVATLSTPGYRGDHLTLPMRSGMQPRLNRSADAPEFAINMWVLGETTAGVIPASQIGRKTQFEANLETILRIFSQQTRPIILTRYPVTGFNRYANVMMTDAISPTTMMQRQRAEFAATFVVLDAFWQDDTVSSSAGTASATLPQVVSLTGLAGGTAPIEDAVATVAGPIVNPRITTLETGSWIQYSGSLIAGDSWVVDAGAFTSKKNGASVQSLTSHAGHARFIYIPPRYGQTNTPALQLNGTGGAATTNLTVSARRKWLLP